MNRYKLSQLRMNIGYNQEDLQKAITQEIGCKAENIRIIKQSIDARKKPNVFYMLSVAFSCTRQLNLPEYIDDDITLDSVVLEHRVANNVGRVAVIGSGPAGLFAALTLAKAGVGVDIFERGYSVEKRQKSVLTFQKSGDLDINGNIQFGEGGAGTFSDGKLNTGIKSEYSRCVIQEFIRHGAHDDIGYLAKPHMGTDVLRQVVKSMREEIIKLGCKVHFESQVTDIGISNGDIKYIIANGDKQEYSNVIMACGHSARDTYAMLLARGVAMQSKPFAIGARIEHPQALIDNSQYGSGTKGLPPAEYKLAADIGGGKGCYTFCMCPGGEIVAAASEAGCVVTNGMSRRARDTGYANSAILVNVDARDYGDDIMGGIEFQRRFESKAFSRGESYSAPSINAKDLIAGGESTKLIRETTYSRGCYQGKFTQCLPNNVISGMIKGIRAFGKKIQGFDTEGVLVGVETRSSAPVRIVRDDSCQSNIKGLYPCGEGAGYAGGIISSAVDGIRVALAVLASVKGENNGR